MTIETPVYLTAPKPAAFTYGTLRYKSGYYRIEDASPAVMEMAKRVFPGCDFTGSRKSGVVRFRATRRAVGDLNWLMTRYPLVIDDPAQYEADLAGAVDHAVRITVNNGALTAAVPPTQFAGTLYGFQAEGVTFMGNNARSLLADDMGLGKTVTALAALVTHEALPALLIVPPNVREQWQEAAGNWLNITPDGELVRDLSGAGLCEMLMGTTARPLSDRPLFITSYNLLPYWKDAILERGIRTVIFDEIQEMRHTGTLKYSAASLIAGAADRVWGLSGTPIYNYGIEIWSVMNIIDYHCLGDCESFTREWCTGYHEKIVAKPEALRDHLRREGLMLRRRKADVLSSLPPKHRAAHFVDHDADRYAALMAGVMRLVESYDQIHGWHERGQAALEIDSQSRRATGISKAPYAAKFIASLIAAGERPLIYAWHHDVHDIIAEGLGDKRLGRITGKETQKAKRRCVKAFAAGELDAVLMSLRSTAGLDGLQSRATCVVFVELDWSPAVHSQCEDRLHRVGIGKIDQVMCYYLVSRTGYDGVVMDALGVKIGQFTGIMGDDPDTREKQDVSNQKAAEHLQWVIDRLRAETGQAQSAVA